MVGKADIVRVTGTERMQHLAARSTHAALHNRRPHSLPTLAVFLSAGRGRASRVRRRLWSSRRKRGVAGGRAFAVGQGKGQRRTKLRAAWPVVGVQRHQPMAEFEAQRTKTHGP